MNSEEESRTKKWAIAAIGINALGVILGFSYGFATEPEFLGIFATTVGGFLGGNLAGRGLLSVAGITQEKLEEFVRPGEMKGVKGELLRPILREIERLDREIAYQKEQEQEIRRAKKSAKRSLGGSDGTKKYFTRIAPSLATPREAASQKHWFPNKENVSPRKVYQTARRSK